MHATDIARDKTRWLSLLIPLIVFLCGAVWTVGAIKGSTGKLEVSMSSLTDIMHRMDRRIQSLDARLESFNTRISRLEGHLQASKESIP